VPIGLPVLDISGLNNFSRPKPHLLLKPINTGTNAPAKGSTTALPQSGTGIGGTYLGNDFRKCLRFPRHRRPGRVRRWHSWSLTVILPVTFSNMSN